MSHKSSINEVIKENIKKRNSKNKENVIHLKDIIEQDKNNSFNQLLSLQLLVQKHSGLKGLCKKNS